MKFKVRNKSPIFILLFFSALLITGLMVKDDPPLFWNFTASEPIGIYRKVYNMELHEGDMVIMNIPESVKEFAYINGIIRPDEYLLKTIYAMPGRSYTITNQEVLIDDIRVGPVYSEGRAGMILPQVRGTYIVKNGNFFPLATNKQNSFDGRYFGEVPQTLIVAKVKPLITFRGGYVEEASAYLRNLF